jgi:hypothetical protein
MHSIDHFGQQSNTSMTPVTPSPGTGTLKEIRYGIRRKNWSPPIYLMAGGYWCKNPSMAMQFTSLQVVYMLYQKLNPMMPTTMEIVKL